MQLKTFDLNLLLVFDAVSRERSVTKAGEKLGLSQPAMSHALSRLRWLLKDQLFVRTPEGMMPTPRAEHLGEPIRRALYDLQRSLDPESFDPAQSHRRFLVAVNNYAGKVLTAPLLCACSQLAPNVRLCVRPSGALDVTEMLDRGELDLAILGRRPTGDRFASETLVEDDFVVVTRSGHPIAQRRMEIEDLAEWPHLSITSSGDDLGFVDAELEARGLARSIAAEAPYLAAGAILTQSDMVAVMGRQIAGAFGQAHATQMTPLPFPSRKLVSVMVWHSRFDDHPAHQWLRAAARTAAAQF